MVRFSGLLNEGVMLLILLIAAFTWFYPARIVRTQIQTLRHREFVEAAEMTGAGDARIMRTHLLPHVLPPLLVYGTLLVATNIMIEVGVTFLNVGIKLPTASWGSMLAADLGLDAQPEPYNPATTQPWLTLIPSIAIFLTVFALNQFGEGLREAFDPRRRADGAVYVLSAASPSPSCCSGCCRSITFAMYREDPGRARPASSSTCSTRRPQQIAQAHHALGADRPSRAVREVRLCALAHGDFGSRGRPPASLHAARSDGLAGRPVAPSAAACHRLARLRRHVVLLLIASRSARSPRRGHAR